MLYLVTGAFRSCAQRQRHHGIFIVQAFSNSLSQRVTIRHKSTKPSTSSTKVPPHSYHKANHDPQSRHHNHNNNKIAWNLKASKVDNPSAKFRAERVLAARTGRARADCRTMLKQRRVWEHVSLESLGPTEHAHEVSATLPVLRHSDEERRDEYGLTPDFRVQRQEDKKNKNKTEEDEDDPNNLMATEMTVQGYFKPVPGPSTQLKMDAVLLLDKKQYIPLPPPLLVAYHKPKWVLSVRKDRENRPCLEPSLLPGFHPVGRLDYDSSGLLLFSSSGQLTQRLLHPKHQVSKVYKATCVGNVDVEVLRQQLAAGVKTSEGIHTAELLDVVHFEHASVQPYLDEVKRNIPTSDYNLQDLSHKGHLDVLDATELSVVRLTVHEGKHRMVRRMLANTGHPVVSLEREQLGIIVLGDLPPGAWRPLTAQESQWAQRQLPKKPKSKYVLKKKRALDEAGFDNGESHEEAAQQQSQQESSEGGDSEGSTSRPKEFEFFRPQDEELIKQKAAEPRKRKSS